MSTASPIRSEEDQPKAKRQTKQKEYVPKKGSANYAFLICMAKGHKLGKEHFMKAELMQAAEDSGLAEKSIYGNPEAAKDSNFSYDGWSNIKTLTNREPPLVKRWGNPVKVALTSEGEALANRLLETAVKDGQTEEVETAEAAAAVEIEEEQAEDEDDDDYKPDDAAKEAAADDAELDADAEADVDEGVDPGEVDDKIDAEAEARVAKADKLVEVGGKGGEVTVEVEEKEEEGKRASGKRPAKRAKKAKAADEDYVELSDEDAEPAPKGKGKKAPPAKRTRAAASKKSRKAASTESDESED